MADTNRSLDDLFAEARTEPPVLTRDEAEHLIAHHPTPVGVILPRIEWQRNIMVGLILTSAAVVAILLYGPESSERTTSSSNYAPGVTTESSDMAVEKAPSAQTSSLDSTAPGETAPGPTGSSGSSSGTVPGAPVQDESPQARPTTGTERTWGYTLLAGQRLRYRYVSEYSHPSINESFTETALLELFVEAIADDGTATLVVTRTEGTLEEHSKPVLPDGIVLERGSQPERMRARVSRLGEVLAGEIVADKAPETAPKGMLITLENGEEMKETPKVQIVASYLGRILPRLPRELDVAPRNTARDSTVRSYQVPSYRDGVWSISMHHDTIRTTTSIVGSRTIGGQHCMIVVANTTTSSQDPGGERSVFSEVDELYLRRADGIPMRSVQTSTSHRGSDGTSSRSTLELIGEDGPSGSAATRPEGID